MLQWCPAGRVSALYAAYRLIMAVIFVAGVATHLAISKLGAKWFIYLTDQGILFLTLHHVLEAILVLRRFFWERFNKAPAKTCKLQISQIM